MASPATSSHLPALAEPHEREAIAHELQSTMQELVDLSLIGKRLHWAVVGHAFRPVHEHLDELVASWRELADVLAERAVALGYVPDGQARAVAQPGRRCRRSQPRRSSSTHWYGPSPTGSRRSVRPRASAWTGSPNATRSRRTC